MCTVFIQANSHEGWHVGQERTHYILGWMQDVVLALAVTDTKYQNCIKIKLGGFDISVSSF